VKRKLFLAVAAVAVGAAITTTGASAASDAATVSHTPVWEDPGLSLICGIENDVLSKTKVLCQGTGVPRPAHSSLEEGDPAVTLAAEGKPQLVLISQDSYPPHASARRLGAGRTWSSRGVTCTISAHAVTCRNAQKHGFTLTDHRYRAF
jgi:hypothetical protein